MEDSKFYFSCRNSESNMCLLVLFLLLDTVSSLSMPKSCVNCEELHVKLGQQFAFPSQMPRHTFRCPDVCDCPSVPPQCQDGVPLVLDGCGCCLVCARQQGDVCNSVQVCDLARKLQCIYMDHFSTSGICRVRRGQSCRVGQAAYKDGETFKMDCRTQCTCQNGTYGCVSLCPHENVKPSSSCHHPQLVKMHGSCCREWLCDSTIMEDRKEHCQLYTSEWTACSRSCGVGFSSRISNNNPECQLKNETRLCTMRPCSGQEEQTLIHGHHVRKNHMCRATVRSTYPIRLTDGGNCTSVDLYQPKYCGKCTTHRCCQPRITTNKRIQFRCVDDEGINVLQKDVLWIIKCNCTEIC